MCGFPLLAAVQGAVFYPPTWLLMLLPFAARSLSGYSGCVDASEEGRTQLTQVFR